MIIDEEVVVEEEAIENTEVSEEEVIENTETLEDEETPEDEEEDRIVTIGEPEEEETPEEVVQETPGWVKKVRKVNREQEREIKRLKKQLDTVTAPQEEVVELGPKPTLESAKFDDKKFEKDLLDWHERSKKVEEQKIQQQKVVENQQKAWQEKQAHYASLKQEHKFKDFKEAEESVSETFNKVQQGIIVQGADDPALLVYALGKNSKKLEELSKITDPVEFTFAIAKLEAKLKVTSRKAPAPEKRVSGGKTGSGSIDRTLDKLRAEADKSGDYTKVVAYKKKLRS